MVRKLLRFLFKVVAAVVFFVVCSAAAVIFDGLNDQGAKADAALVVDAPVPVKGEPNLVLDRAVELHRSGEVSSIIVVSSKWLGEGQAGGAAAVAKYLEARGVPADDIVESDRGGTLQETAHAVVAIAKDHQLLSILIVAEYYDLTRLKVAVGNEGYKSLGTVHVGTVNKDDALKIVNSVVSLYQYVGKVYLLPEAEEVKKEAQSGLDKAKVEADHAKDKVDKGLDNLPK